MVKLTEINLIMIDFKYYYENHLLIFIIILVIFTIFCLNIFRRFNLIR